MATIDLSNSTQFVDMTASSLVKFGNIETRAPTHWSWTTSASHDVDLEGNGFVFDKDGRAVKGTVSSIQIDFGNGNFGEPDVLITDIKVPAASLGGSHYDFWRFLEGNDTIIAPTTHDLINNVIFGDILQVAKAGSYKGGNDTIQLGASYTALAGDAWEVGRSIASKAKVKYQGGADTIIGEETEYDQWISGDVRAVYGTGQVTGGNDTIFIRSGNLDSQAVGDVGEVQGIAGSIGTVFGGNDTIIAGGISEAVLVGDVYYQGPYSFVRGGNDRIVGSDNSERIVGDVHLVNDNRLEGGNDLLFGNGGDDDIYGDFYEVGLAGRIKAGNDTLYGGGGADFLYGDGEDVPQVTGGNDRLYGEAGADGLVGGGGNDLLDGGADEDTMYGGTGNDTYVVDSAFDEIVEYENQGIDTVRTFYASATLQDHVENLTFIGQGDFQAVGNSLDNTIIGGSGEDFLQGFAGHDRLFGRGNADTLMGGMGDDVLNGGAGGDYLDGNQGFDLVSYAGSERGVSASLGPQITASGDALGDAFVGIEGFIGTSFTDLLIGNDYANTLNGGAGDDGLSGLSGMDTLIGGLGNDRLGGGLAADTLTGGAGGDRFIFAINDSTVAAGIDRITDFSHAQRDRIDLSQIDAKTLVTGDQAFTFIGKAAFSKTAGELRFKQASVTIVEGDVDGNGTADFQIQLTGSKALVAGDFIL